MRQDCRLVILALASAFLLLALPKSTLAQPTPSPSPEDKVPVWLQEADLYAKIIGGSLAAVVTLLGLPMAVMQFRKTRVEIRKLEAEARSLEGNLAEGASAVAGHRIVIDGSNNTVKILADPRFLGPLLLLLAFILAWVLITLAGYAVGLFVPGQLERLIVGVLAALLLVPIAREARRIRAALRTSATQEADPEKQAVQQ